MRFTLALLAAACFAQPAPEKSAITGRVVNASTGGPLKKAAVWLEAFSATRGVNGERTVTLPATVTDAEGRFTLDQLPPGDYLLAAKRVGYLDQGYGASAPLVVGPPLTVKPGETLRDIVIKLTPQSFVYGKVVDEDGDAITGARVEILKRGSVEVAAAESQDDGSFVIGNLMPGRYFVRAEAAPLDEEPGRERHVATYYPSSPDASSATPVEVGAGAEVRNISIRLRKSRVFTIRGRVLPAERVSLKLDESRTFGTAADGRFEFTGLQPGTYEIRTNSAVQTLVGRASVTISDGDVEDVVLRLSEGASIDGQVKGAAAGRVTVGEETADIKPDGSFELDGLVPALHPLEVSGLPEGSYVKAVNFSGAAIDDWKLDLTSGAGGELLILVSPDGGEISGTIANAPGVLVQVWPAGGDSARAVKTDVRGAFRIHSLPPGEYRVAAFQGLDDDLARDPQFRARFESSAATVKLSEKGRERVELKLIGRDAIAAEAAKLR